MCSRGPALRIAGGTCCAKSFATTHQSSSHSAQDFFSPRLIQPRKPLSDRAKRWVDSVLYREKLRSLHPLLNRFKDAEVEYTPAEIQASRLLAKNIDGMIYANDLWAEMYPDAAFFGLVRNGLAICEGHVRRGRSADAIGRRYQLLVEKMLDDCARLQRYCLVRFESLLAVPGKPSRRRALMSD